MSPQPDEEDLARIFSSGIPMATKLDFQGKLRGKIGRLSAAQLSAFTNAWTNITQTFKAAEVKTYKYPYGEKTYYRYVIPGVAGFWTYKAVAAWVKQQPKP